MKYAVIQLGGKQLKVSEGDVFEIERQDKLNIDVLMLSDEGKVKIGEPVLKDVKISAKILDQKLAKKVSVKRFRSKSRYKKNKGHRQPISVVKIESIGSSSAKATTKKAKTVKSPKKEVAAKAK